MIIFFCKDVAEINGQFEVITLIEVLEHIPDDSIIPFLNTIRTRLSTEGKLCISVPSINIPVNKKHYRHYSLELLTKTLKAAGFEITHVYYIYKKYWLIETIRRLITNRFYMLKASALTKYLWHLHQRATYMAEEHNALHIVAEARIDSTII